MMIHAINIGLGLIKHVIIVEKIYIA